MQLVNKLLREFSFNEVQENYFESDEPLAQFTHQLLDNAYNQSASDIHIEPYQKLCRIRYRIDGILYVIIEIPIPLMERLITKLKVMSKLDISEKRLPQDGRFQHKAIDIRVNTCPTLFGEKIVLRLLDSGKISLDIEKLGFLKWQYDIFIKKISQPQGMILVTGPTGSGKTVTLYSALQFLNNNEKNISTVEDPIEIQLKGINQVNINPKIGLHFATVLRTLLRQDPDIIMLGEIRDKETAEVAIQAAQTGHLVFSTLHTNNSFDTLIRLQSMGLSTYHITHSISLIIAQRLVRKKCLSCIASCDKCKNGFKGRTAIYEILNISPAIIQLLEKQAPANAILAKAKEQGFQSLYEVGTNKVNEGITNLSELNRVLSK